MFILCIALVKDLRRDPLVEMGAAHASGPGASIRWSERCPSG